MNLPPSPAPQNSGLITTRRWGGRQAASWSVLLLSTVALACGSEAFDGPNGSDGSGGETSGSGGSSGVGTGGTSASGGDTAAGGSPSGGQDGAGGTVNTGGTAGSGGSGSGGGANAYEPCPATGDCKILPLGDSITWGVGDEANGGYRGPLFEHFVADDKQATFTGSGQNGPSMVSGVTFPKRNEGHSGWGIARVTTWSGGNAGIATRIPSPAFDSGSGGAPHIILLHIGTNDANQFTADVMEGDLNILLDKLVAGAPDALIVLAKIIPLGWNNAALTTYNSKLAGIVETRAEAGEHIVFADLNTGFDTNTMLDADDIHPNAAGYQFMADRWYGVLEPFLR